MKSFFLKSKAKEYRDDYTKEALKARYLIMQRSKKKFSQGFYSFRKKVIEKAVLKEQQFKFKKEKKISSDLDRFMDALFFLNHRRAN
jgi:hypothetical protein